MGQAGRETGMAARQSEVFILAALSVPDREHAAGDSLVALRNPPYCIKSRGLALAVSTADVSTGVPRQISVRRPNTATALKGKEENQ